jgi:hypothetical protein
MFDELDSADVPSPSIHIPSIVLVNLIEPFMPAMVQFQLPMRKCIGAIFGIDCVTVGGIAWAPAKHGTANNAAAHAVAIVSERSFIFLPSLSLTAIVRRSGEQRITQRA